jgi:hypothetical protein
VEGIEGERLEGWRVEEKGAMAKRGATFWLVLARGSWQIVGQAIPSLRGGRGVRGKMHKHNTANTNPETQEKTPGGKLTLELQQELCTK